MKISYNWLKDYIQIELDPERLAEILTSTGLEVGGVEKIESIKGGLKGVVAGKVETCVKHPNADRLSLCTVDLGNGEPVQIVCGAPNVASGQKVWVATVGTELHPTGSEEGFVIKKAKVRGETSEGMICAEDELGLGADHDGIMVLPDEVVPGSRASDYYEVSEDFVIDIDLTPNRSDATSHLGVARDLAAYLTVNGDKPIDVNYPAAEIDELSGETAGLTVAVENTEACPRYAGLVIKDLEIGESPQWLKDRLNAVGVRPISNVVDITNYVLHEMGQPLHAFDMDKIGGNGIVVKTLSEGTEFISLDEVTRKLTDKDLMICNANGEGMCIGGVFGGLGTGVSDTTTSIFLESAHFDPEWIRRSSMHHQLRTDAARTFEKTTDPNICVDALKRAASLMVELAGGRIASEIVDIYPNVVEPKEVKLKWAQINKLTGVDLDRNDVIRVLDAQKIEVVSQDDDSLIVRVPTDKADVTREADVIEEILRIYGYDHVPMRSKMDVGLSAVHGVTPYQMRNIVGSFLAAQGFSEMMGMSITDDNNLELGVLGIEADARVMIENTSNISLNTMRPDLLVTALEAVRYNQNRNQEDFRLFEFGHGYVKGEEGIEEKEYLSFVLVGKEVPDNWTSSQPSTADFFALKKYVEGLMAKIGLTRWRTQRGEDSRLQPSLTYSLGKQAVVTFGQVDQDIVSAFDIRYDVYCAQFEVEPLYKAMQRNTIVTGEVSKYPAMKRDLAFVLDESVKYEQLEKTVRQAAGKLLTDTDLFDVYRNDDHLGPGLKSYAIQMTYEDPSRTLTDAEVDQVIQGIVSKVEKDLGGKLRG